MVNSCPAVGGLTHQCLNPVGDMACLHENSHPKSMHFVMTRLSPYSGSGSMVIWLPRQVTFLCKSCACIGATPQLFFIRLSYEVIHKSSGLSLAHLSLRSSACRPPLRTLYYAPLELHPLGWCVCKPHTVSPVHATVLVFVFYFHHWCSPVLHRCPFARVYGVMHTHLRLSRSPYGRLWPLLLSRTSCLH